MTQKNMKSIKLNSKDLIATRKTIDENINKYRRIIRFENVMPMKAVKSNQGSGFDLKMLLNKINQMSDLRIKIKGALQYLNIGYDNFSYEEFKKTHYFAIFKACEEKEKMTFLKMLRETCINPAEKSKKGLKGTGKREIFSTAKIDSLIKETQLEINKYDTKIAEFNDSASINFDELDDELKSMLTT